MHSNPPSVRLDSQPLEKHAGCAVYMTINLHSSAGEEHSGISTDYAASVGADLFAPTNPPTEEFSHLPVK